MNEDPKAHAAALAAEARCLHDDFDLPLGPQEYIPPSTTITGECSDAYQAFVSAAAGLKRATAMQQEAQAAYRAALERLSALVTG